MGDERTGLTVHWWKPDLAPRVLGAEEWRRRWRQLDRKERAWVREAALRPERHAEPGIQQLVAAYAWWQMRTLERVAWGSFLTVGVIVIMLALAGRQVATLPLIAVTFPLIAVRQQRRLAASLALNIGPPPP
jgi:hypothetical protein